MVERVGYANQLATPMEMVEWVGHTKQLATPLGDGGVGGPYQAASNSKGDVIVLP